MFIECDFNDVLQWQIHKIHILREKLNKKLIANPKPKWYIFSQEKWVLKHQKEYRKSYSYNTIINNMKNLINIIDLMKSDNSSTIFLDSTEYKNFRLYMLSSKLKSN